MNYIANSKNRKLKNKIHSILHRLSFNFFHLSMGRKIVGIGAFFSFVSLFLGWFTLTENASYNNAFSLQVGYAGYVILLLLMVLSAFLLSDQKDAGKSRIPVAIHDYSVMMFVGITMLLLSFVTLNVMRGFVLLYQNFTIGNGVVFESIGAIFIILGSVLYYRERRRDMQSLVYVENSQANLSILDEYEEILKKNDPNKKNMTLPI